MMRAISMLKNNILQRLIILTSFFYTCFFSYSQIEGWQVYPSYSEPVQVESAGDYVYCIMKGSGTIDSNSGNLVRLDIEDGSIKVFDCLNDLNDKEICKVSYNYSSRTLVILYESGNIDLLKDDGTVINISALNENQIYGRQINSVSHVGNIAYLCTGFGFVKVDLEENIIRDTYMHETPIYSVHTIEERVYIAKADGFFCVDSEKQMYDKNKWEKLSDLTFQELVPFANQLYALSNNRLYYLIPSEQGLEIKATSYYFTHLTASPDKLICTDSGKWLGLFDVDSPQKPMIIQQNYQWNDVTYHSGNLYACEKSRGLLQYVINEQELTFSSTSESSILTVSSPKRDLFYRMNFVGERMLVAGGINTQLASYYPVTFMFFEEDHSGDSKWTLFDELSFKKMYPKLTHYNGVDLVQDPIDDKHFFGAVYRNGLHEYRMDADGKVNFVKLYNYENSPLQCIDVNTSSPWNYCTCTSLKYDSKGNLWMANQQTDTIIRVMRPNGKWLSLYYPEIVCAENVLQYFFSTHGINFMVIYECGKRGFFGFDSGGTLNVVDDDSRLLRNTITNQDGITVVPTQFYCMTEDQDQQIWCGTNEGLFVITRPQEWFDSDFRFHQIKRNRNDGSGFADYLLSGVDITCIAVDPSNRKWIGTLSNGVYLVTHDGQETIHHFTKANSPLLSDRIHSIAINPDDGRVMFGTDAGLCSYTEDVVEPENDLSEDKLIVFPNPVTPNTNATVTIQGLTDGAEVKILSSSGQVIWGTKSIGGRVLWNCCNEQGKRVSSGVYHVVCNTHDAGKTIVNRIVVLR